MPEVNQTAQDLYLIIKLNEQSFAIPVDITRDMVKMPKVFNVPKVPPHVRGVINLRGKVIPIIDLRKKLGMVSYLTEQRELVDLMTQREQDHHKWLDELKASIEEAREFTLTTDPHQCAFGKWYYSDEAAKVMADNAILKTILNKFEDPHVRIHGIAKEVTAMNADGDHEGALALIDKTKETTLAEMVRLFGEARAQINESREIAVVLTTDDGKTAAVAVDMVESVEKLVLKENEMQSHTSLNLDDNAVSAIGERLRDDSKGMVIVLDLKDLMSVSVQNIKM